MRLFALFPLLFGALLQADPTTLAQAPATTEEQHEMLRNLSQERREAIPRQLGIEAATSIIYNLAISAAAVNSF